MYTKIRMKIAPGVFNDVILDKGTTFTMHGKLGPVKVSVDEGNYLIISDLDAWSTFENMLGRQQFANIKRWYNVRGISKTLGPFKDMDNIRIFLTNRLTEGMTITDDQGVPIQYVTLA